MRDVILALNAGSSSIKFSLFASTSGVDTFSLVYQGEVEDFGKEPRFHVYNAVGQRQGDEQLSAKGAISHEEALGILLKWIERHEAGWRLITVGPQKRGSRRPCPISWQVFGSHSTQHDHERIGISCSVHLTWLDLLGLSLPQGRDRSDGFSIISQVWCAFQRILAHLIRRHYKYSPGMTRIQAFRITDRSQ